MAESSLIAALEEDARAQADRLVEEAKEEADALLKEAAREADAEKERLSLELETRLEADGAAVLNNARARAAAASLAVRNTLIDRVMGEAEKRLSSLARDEHAVLLSRLFAELEAVWKKERPGEAPVVLVSPVDVSLVKSGYRVVGDEGVKSGVVFASEDGRVRFENSISARLGKCRAVMAPAIDEMLFGGVFQ